ncbi:hypothetical protein JTE90_029385 [Oedothorax gibbosus]|uniref:XK-related protein n=1 Tax=Oedothorax gibbosus TaxID=931172 RepID=A0AAV6VP96_9ARAC|nr:hypothetical protein JTE90_029385 [Oedothorax gibbosus]
MESPNDSYSPLTKSDIPYIDGEMETEDCKPDGSEPINSPPTNGTNNKDDKPTAGPTPDIVLSLMGRFSFPFLLISSVYQLFVYLNKLYQDSHAVEQYYADRTGYCIVSAACLLLPALMYIIYEVSAYIKDQEEVENKEVGTKVVHGMLLVPWQIKSRLEVMNFSASRVCQRRPLTPDELIEKSSLDRRAAVLEFFEEFYAGLTQLLLQLYIIVRCLDKNMEYQALTGEIIASGLTLMAMLAAVRRRDDYILTGFLSITGWLSITISRTVCIALATTVIHGWMALVCTVHGILMSIWITKIAMATYYRDDPSLVFTRKRKTALFFLVFAVFGLPSLTYWPILFELKKHRRPLIFLFVMLVENVVFVGLWVCFKEKSWGSHDHLFVFAAAGTFALGALFILFYICCKPKYTDEVVYDAMKNARNADSFGMYFEFCDKAFKLKIKEDLVKKLKSDREHKRVERKVSAINKEWFSCCSS